MSSQIPVSVLILTLNEAVNLSRCLAALNWTDDIVVLDSNSTDDTAEIARSRGARVYYRDFDDFASQRNHALECIEFRHDWVLHLDADEVVTDALRDEIAAAIAQTQYVAWRIAGKLMLGEKWLRFAGMYPVYQVRLGRKDALRFQQAGHGQRETVESGQIGTLKQPYLHFGFSKGLGDWIERHNRYSSAEAASNVRGEAKPEQSARALFAVDATQRRRSVKRLARRLPFRPFLRFVYMYLLRLGFLDGTAGWTYARLMAQYEYWTVLKERELRRERSGC